MPLQIPKLAIQIFKEITMTFYQLQNFMLRRAHFMYLMCVDTSIAEINSTAAAAHLQR